MASLHWVATFLLPICRGRVITTRMPSLSPSVWFATTCSLLSMLMSIRWRCATRSVAWRSSPMTFPTSARRQPRIWTRMV
ncbi:hypothetical protein EVA_15467 [gut metagenome]|uniref:Uncharacterized protein n=1 Tax=gut metagenome TaxID=749906 RepID=J9FNA5_9ZZZZ